MALQRPRRAATVGANYKLSQEGFGRVIQPTPEVKRRKVRASFHPCSFLLNWHAAAPDIGVLATHPLRHPLMHRLLACAPVPLQKAAVSSVKKTKPGNWEGYKNRLNNIFYKVRCPTPAPPRPPPPLHPPPPPGFLSPSPPAPSSPSHRCGT